MRRQALIGNSYNRLTILDEAGINKYGQRLVKVRCSCGKVSVKVSSNVTIGRIKSCGCLQRERSAECGRRKKAYIWRPNNGGVGTRKTTVSRKYPDNYGKCPRGSYASFVLNEIRQSVRRREKTWTLDPLEAFELCLKPCFYCKAESNWPESRNGIDRLDSNVGYQPGNVVSCCWRCNYSKNDQSVDEFKQFILRLAANAHAW